MFLCCLCCTSSWNLWSIWVFMRPSSLWEGRILRRTLSVRLSVCPSVPLSLPSVTSRHLANYNDTHVLFGTRWGPHIVRPSRPHRFLFYTNFFFIERHSLLIYLPQYMCYMLAEWIFREKNSHSASFERQANFAFCQYSPAVLFVAYSIYT